VVKALTAGGAHACGIFNESGVVYCWGDNSRGQLGVGDNVSRARPEVAVNLNGKKAVSVAAGFEHTCALTDDYYIYCWGAGTEEQLGFVNVDSNVPVFVSNVFDGITKLSAGFSTSCGIATTGAYVNQTICWGSNDEGQMGWQNIYSSPYLSGWWAVSDLAIGVSHSCGIISGAVKCSGAGGNGQLGNGLFSDSLTPVDVEGIVGEAVEVSAG
jgi:alpha-tubulin suppressor-like RCC1 family protein